MVPNKPSIVVIILVTILVFVNSSNLYEVNIKDFEPIIKGDLKHLNLDKFKLKRFNRTHPHVIIGELEVFEDLENDVEVTGELYKQQGYEYRPTPYKVKYQVCDFIASETHFYPTVLEHSDLVKPGTVRYSIRFKTNNFILLFFILVSNTGEIVSYLWILHRCR